MAEHENIKGVSSTGKLPDDELVFGKSGLLGRVFISLPWTFPLIIFCLLWVQDRLNGDEPWSVLFILAACGSLIALMVDEVTINITKRTYMYRSGVFPFISSSMGSLTDVAIVIAPCKLGHGRGTRSGYGAQLQDKRMKRAMVTLFTRVEKEEILTLARDLAAQLHVPLTVDID